MIRSVDALQGRKVAIFGLSANPPTGHSGHVGIVEFLVDTDLFDEVWVLPVYQHMFASKRSMEPFEHRVAMCHLCMHDAASSKCKVRVMEIEKYAAEHYANKEGLDFRVGTVDILDYINEFCPGLDLHLVLGTDTYKDLIARKWKQADRILHSVTVHAISRLGIETTGIEVVHDSCLIAIDAAKKDGFAGEIEEIHVKVVHHKVPWLEDVSSSLARRISSSLGIDLSGLVTKRDAAEEMSYAEDEAMIRHLLDDRVLQYIKDHGLYGYTGCGSSQAVVPRDEGESSSEKSKPARRKVRAESVTEDALVAKRAHVAVDVPVPS